jgi:hypothetical protein
MTPLDVGVSVGNPSTVAEVIVVVRVLGFEFASVVVIVSTRVKVVVEVA